MEIVPNLEKQNIKLIDHNENLEVKIKFFEVENGDDEEEEEEEETYEFNKRLRMRLVKKKGDLATWYGLFEEMKASVFDGVLLAPETHQADTLETNDSY